ncbi:hypothetical protein OIV83_005449 [Microbotryomycetes sp. JL201]|nr:hypothetical protein OIV83_005449 [Microbotryomycetes sp. JL201]
MLVARPLGQQQHSLHMIPTQPTSSTSSLVPCPPSASKPASTGHSAIIINGRLTPTAPLPTSGGRIKKFKCTFDGCDKAYTRPVRLEEHLRSHTGERPFACSQCDASFQRDSHLKAHQRTHLPASAKSYECQECDRKFWTGQHLRKHVEVMHRGKTYDLTHLKTHLKTHDQCLGKTFTTSRGLRKHLQGVHSDDPGSRRRRHRGKVALDATDIGFPGETEETARETDYSALDGDSDHELRPRKKQKQKAIDARVFEGNEDMPPLPELPPLPDSLQAANGATSALQLLTGFGYAPSPSKPDSTGTPQRKFACPFPSIVTRGPAKVIQKAAPIHTATSMPSTRRTSPVVEVVVPSSSRSSPGTQSTMTDDNVQHETTAPQPVSCEYWFHRLYDVERHLRSWHKVAVSTQELKTWYNRATENERL